MATRCSACCARSCRPSGSADDDPDTTEDSRLSRTDCRSLCRRPPARGQSGGFIASIAAFVRHISVSYTLDLPFGRTRSFWPLRPKTRPALAPAGCSMLALFSAVSRSEPWPPRSPSASSHSRSASNNSRLNSSASNPVGDTWSPGKRGARTRGARSWSARWYWRRLNKGCWKNRFCGDGWMGRWNGPMIGRCLGSTLLAHECPGATASICASGRCSELASRCNLRLYRSRKILRKRCAGCRIVSACHEQLHHGVPPVAPRDGVVPELIRL